MKKRTERVVHVNATIGAMALMAIGIPPRTRTDNDNQNRYGSGDNGRNITQSATPIPTITLSNIIKDANQVYLAGASTNQERNWSKSGFLSSSFISK